MKQILTFLILAVLIIPAYNQSDSTKNKLKAAAVVSLNTDGIAPVPSFSLDKPAIIANLALTKGRFSYEPGLAYSLELKPWYIDNWLNYRFVNKQKFTFTVGFNASSFFAGDTLKNNKSVLRVERYFALAFTAWFKLSENSGLTASYWSDNGQDGGLKGHFASLIAERTHILTGNKTFFNASLQVFYINYEGKNDGLFITPRASFNIVNSPLSVFILGTQALQSNIDPYPEFKWNLGIAYAM